MGAERGQTESRALLFAVLVFLPMAVALASPAMATSAISAQVFPSVGTVSQGSGFSVAVVVSNSGGAVAQDVSAALVLPSGWTSTPSEGTLQSLSPTQSGVLKFAVTVPNTASDAQYTILAMVNSTVGSTVGDGTIQVAAVSVALPSGLIPISLILVLIPGVLSTSIFAWVTGVGLSADWRTALVAFLVGSLEWFVAPWPLGGSLERNVLTLNLQPSSSDLWSIAILVAVVGAVPGGAFAGFRYLVPRLESRIEDLLRTLRSTQAKTTDTLDYALTRALRKSMKTSSRALPLLEVAADSNPEVTFKGLLKAFDDKPPYDLLLVPRYRVEVDSEDFPTWVGKLPWSSRRKIQDIQPDRWRWELKLKERIKMSAKIGDKVRKDYWKGLPYTPRPTPIGGLEIETLIKGGDIHRIKVLGYVSPYLIAVNENGNVTELP